MTDAISRSNAISRSAALSMMDEYIDMARDDEIHHAMCVVAAGLAELPTLDVAPVVHARWTDDGECTRCGCTAEYTEYATERYDYDWNENLMPCEVVYHRSYHTTDFCPNCGARMDGEEDAAD